MRERSLVPRFPRRLGPRADSNQPAKPASEPSRWTAPRHVPLIRTRPPSRAFSRDRQVPRQPLVLLQPVTGSRERAGAGEGIGGASIPSRSATRRDCRGRGRGARRKRGSPRRGPCRQGFQIRPQRLITASDSRGQGLPASACPARYAPLRPTKHMPPAKHGEVGEVQFPIRHRHQFARSWKHIFPRPIVGEAVPPPEQCCRECRIPPRALQ